MQYFKFCNFAKSKPDLVETNCKFMFPKPGSDGFLLNITETPSLDITSKFLLTSSSQVETIINEFGNIFLYILHVSKEN